MQNSPHFFLFNHSSWVSPGWFFFYQTLPCCTPAVYCFIDFKSSLLQSCILFYRGTYFRNTSGHGYLAPSSVSLLEAHSPGSKCLLSNLPPKSTTGPLPAQIQEPSLDLPAATRQLWTDNCKRQLRFLVSSAGSGGPREDIDWGFINPNERTKGSLILHISLRVSWGAPSGSPGCGASGKTLSIFPKGSAMGSKLFAATSSWTSGFLGR